ncbi:hypothetical protein C9994_06470 [Marivirga lumbricoides]|uniref:Uncharacterized protein n=1 Tax=Marivirga lumbricoides TaxID=1046115 RepID=A0A2T4DS28_9BACT|nr:hypothetical protein C9994_06470 [Marivirga lumbricoides]
MISALTNCRKALKYYSAWTTTLLGCRWRTVIKTIPAAKTVTGTMPVAGTTTAPGITRCTTSIMMPLWVGLMWWILMPMSLPI